ncbi:RNA polymerase sigma factor [Mucilaginibacter celer]|uniref:RNA polymerase sigma-70 region 2 domain-containing protein n=1 Tax=Mucilaginibacter celer TaxID=2305508 RepID=A0A494VW70_9SPHI|nr:sigma factor [Mucilaginibacter celer]AYL95232.1 hypothetical protein HYN43_007970 [Mucilaginibacter celer]
MKIYPAGTRISDADLCPLIRCDEKKGAGMLYDAYANFLFLNIMRKVQNRELAERLLEETFKKVWHSIPDYKINKERIYTWMKAIADDLAKHALSQLNK